APVVGRLLVTDAAGNSLAAPQSLLVGFSASGRTLIRQTPLDSDGTFHIELTEGEHAVSVNNLRAEYSVKSITSSNIDLKTTPIKVTAATAPPNIQIIIEYSPR